MKTFAIAAALAASITAPVFADGHTLGFAVMHFNMDQDSPGERSLIPMGMMNNVQLTPGSTLAEVFSHLNMDADTQMDATGAGTGGVTIIMRDPTRAAEIFRRLAEESREDD